MSEDVLAEEFEVLESIYAEEMTKVSDREISIIVEPEEPVSGLADFKLVMNVVYPPEYPDVYPDVSLNPEDEDEDLTEEERTKLLSSLEEMGGENTGMAMTFTLVSHLREQLFVVLKARAEKIKQAEVEKERRELEEEEARTKGTPVTLESFLKWRTAFVTEQAEKKRKEEEERMRGWSMKEKEEVKRFAARPTGRQIFERGGAQVEDASLFEEGAESVDVSLFDRTERHEEEAQVTVHLSDSD